MIHGWPDQTTSQAAIYAATCIKSFNLIVNFLSVATQSKRRAAGRDEDHAEEGADHHKTCYHTRTSGTPSLIFQNVWCLVTADPSCPGADDQSLMLSRHETVSLNVHLCRNDVVVGGWLRRLGGRVISTKVATKGGSAVPLIVTFEGSELALCVCYHMGFIAAITSRETKEKQLYFPSCVCTTDTPWAAKQGD